MQETFNPALGYSNWRDFKNAIQKAIRSCEQSGNNPKYHLVGADKQIQFGKGAIQVEKRIKTIKPRLLLDPQDALGIANNLEPSEKN